MIRKLAFAAAAGTLALGLSAAPAMAAGPTEPGNACQRTHQREYERSISRHGSRG